ncbi:MAG: urease accessory protein UreD [Vulcanimicrobiaceae bacterium]
MSATGSVDVVCGLRGDRSRLTSLRSSGLSRTSRAFAERGGAVRVVLGTLGPGVLAGDRFALTGRILARAALVVRGQMATPVFAGQTPSRAWATWAVGDGGLLDAVNEPLVLEAGSEHAARTQVDVEGSGVAILAETVGFRGPARLAVRTSVSLDGALVFRDALALEGSPAAGALGTVVVVARDGALRAAIAEQARTLCASFSGEGRAGLGETAAAVVVRLARFSVWNAHQLSRILAESACALARRR